MIFNNCQIEFNTCKKLDTFIYIDGNVELTDYENDELSVQYFQIFTEIEYKYNFPSILVIIDGEGTINDKNVKRGDSMFIEPDVLVMLKNINNINILKITL